MIFSTLLLPLLTLVSKAASSHGSNSTLDNPILPGFHPDPSCIHVPEWNGTFFCASSSFSAFPGVPIHASNDLQHWKLISNVLNRPEQLPELGQIIGVTSGIWAVTIRFHNGTFYAITTFVHDKLAANDSTRWDNIIFTSANPFDPDSWSTATHFDFVGYDTSPFWDEDGKTYIVGSHAYRVFPAIQIAEANLETGETGDWKPIWNGTGGLAPEGPHIYKKDGYYYLMIAEGGTGLDHMETIARSETITGYYDSYSLNPILTNANTTKFFQTVGHADLFQDDSGNWWGVSLATRSGPAYINYPMGRETVMTSVSWPKDDWPTFSQIAGTINSWPLPPVSKVIGGVGPFIEDGDDVNFEPGSTLPPHFTYLRFPVANTFTISPSGHPNALQINPSLLNLTGLDAASGGPGGQAFVSRRQQASLFTFSVNLEYSPVTANEEAGVTVFLTQQRHLELGIAMLPSPNSTNGTGLEPQIRFRGFSLQQLPDYVIPIPDAWAGQTLSFEIKAFNFTHYAFSVGPAGAPSQMETVIYVSNSYVSGGFTGTMLGVYATSNGGSGSRPAYFSKWSYIPQGQIRS
ncbi:glycoside hydrolase family 43 protein [Xylariales sp. PMI_506]|nr:glycoside hydrolase family 43 protein [Xylariales sp. PMI_506]